MPQTDQAVKVRLREEYEVARDMAAGYRADWHEQIRRHGLDSPEARVAKERMIGAYKVAHAAYRQSKDWRYL